MSIKGRVYGDLTQSCDQDELKRKGITNFDMVDPNLEEILMGDNKE